jgi:hypothetical protein
MLRRSLPSISPWVRASTSFTFGLLIAALTWSAVTTFTVPAFTANVPAAGCRTVVVIARCSAVHFTQPPSSSATFE